MSRESDVHLLQHDLNTPVAYPDDGTPSKKQWKSFGYSGEMRIFVARNSKTRNMERAQIIDNIRQVAARVLPKGSSLYLYGSRARGDNHDDSDWDLLLLLSDEGDSDTAFRQYAYPIISQGYDIWQSFSVHTYSRTSGTTARTPCFIIM